MATSAVFKSERFELRATPAQRAVVDKATATCGLTRSEFILQATMKEAQEVIEKQSIITLGNNAFDRFIDACERADEPNQELKNALKFARESGIG